MKLSVGERLVLLSILPPEGGLRTMRVIHDLRMILALTDKEVKEWEITDQIGPDGRPVGVKWNDEKVQEVDMDVEGVRTEIIVQALRKLDTDKKLSLQHLTLCEKFPIEKT